MKMRNCLRINRPWGTWNIDFNRVAKMVVGAVTLPEKEISIVTKRNRGKCHSNCGRSRDLFCSELLERQLILIAVISRISYLRITKGTANNKWSRLKLIFIWVALMAFYRAIMIHVFIIFACHGRCRCETKTKPRRRVNCRHKDVPCSDKSLWRKSFKIANPCQPQL